MTKVVWVGLALLGACVDSLPARECGVDDDCLQGGVHGQCLESTASANRWCGFPDSSCPVSRERWGILAGDNLANTCVVGAVPDGGSAPRIDAGVGHLRVIVDTTWCAGTVTSSDGAINCGSTCEGDFAAASVTLTATPVSRDGSPCFIDAWLTPSSCGRGSACTVDVDLTPTVMVAFTPRACVDPAAGNDQSPGTCLVPYKTISRALSGTLAGDRVQLKPGAYSAATNGETFPILVPAGVHVIGDEVTKGGVDQIATTSITGEGPVSSNKATFVLENAAMLAGVQPHAPTGIGILLVPNTADQVVRNNTLVTPGDPTSSVGIEVAGGKRVWIHDNDIQNLYNGLGISSTTGRVEHNRIRMNQLGISVGFDSDLFIPDFGGGPDFHGQGRNILSSNSGVDFIVGSLDEASIFAENNCWDHVPPTVGDFEGNDIFLDGGTALVETVGAAPFDSRQCTFP